MEAVYGRCCRLGIAFAFAAMVLAAPGRANADPGITVFPGMEIHQGTAVCMVGLVEPRLRVALTSGQCDGGASAVTDRDHNVIGSVVLARRQSADEPVADSTMLPVEYEVIALAPGTTASDLLPTGRHLRSTPGLRAQPGLPVCQFRRSEGQRCGSVSSVGNGRFVMSDMAVDTRDFGGPVYAVTDDNGAVIVGMFEGMCKSAPKLETWEAVMQQVYIDAGSHSQQQPLPQLHMIGRHQRPAPAGTIAIAT